MANYNLDSVEESFSMTFKDKDGTVLEYDIKYPTTEEMRTIINSSKELENLVKQKADEKVIEKLAKESEKELNDLITPSGHEIPFSEVFGVQTIHVQKKFREIIEKEFGN